MEGINPVALVTGAGRGIGRGVALELAKNGFDIVGNDILFEPDNKASGLFEVKERVEELKTSFLPIKGDISSLDDHGIILRQVLDKFREINVLVNNAGVAPDERLDILETTPENFDGVLSVNARGTFFLTQRIARQMIDQIKKDSELKGKYCIIFISSISAEVSSPSRAEYCISKAAISNMARVFADRLSGFGINVYEVRPGIIKTDMTAPVREKYDRLIEEGLVPQKRWGFPEDVGKAVAALARGDFAYSTGLVVEISGGMNIRHL
ncbi:MAG: 3-ketoacyl-ACP reductase [Candidatus Aminicenantes bacterium]|nr:MAG: 3-ketoacyl-ACP reductase [Candidatus Aminicenantes bacterium]